MMLLSANRNVTATRLNADAQSVLRTTAGARIICDKNGTTKFGGLNLCS